jgi:DNA-binding response OmpR family regulator
MPYAEDVVATEKLLAAPAASLPARLRLLAIVDSQRTIDWLKAAFATDSATQIELVEAIGLAAGIERLHDELFDGILVVHDPANFDALELVSGLRTGGSEEPILVLGRDPQERILAQTLESGADAYLSIDTTTVRALLWTLYRAIERCRLLRENRRLKQFERRRTEQDQRETAHLLLQQRAMVAQLESLHRAGASTPHRIGAGGDRDSTASTGPNVFDAVEATYQELLRSYVIMGGGNVNIEMDQFARLLAHSGLSVRQTLQLHLKAVERLVQGLKARGSRHVLARADLLILEVMVHLAEWYQERYLAASV